MGIFSFLFGSRGEDGKVGAGTAPATPQLKGSTGAEQTIKVGSKGVVESKSPSSNFAVVFEDDGDTGYLYGLDYTRKDQPILDAMSIYDVKNVADREKPSKFTIVWSSDGLKAALFVNGYPHAVFDFVAKHGYCRRNFPPPDKNWTSYSHEWSDTALELFK
jgi:hypothetical protein